MSSLADDGIIAEFVAESREHLNAIEPDLLALEQQGAGTGAEVINRIFRAVHSIKGGAGFFAFEALKTLSHVMESVLMQVRDRVMTPSPELIDALLGALDRLRAMLEDIRQSDAIPITEEVARLKAILEGGGHRPGEQVQARGRGPAFKLDADAVRSALKRGMRLYHARAFLHRDLESRWESPFAFIKGALSVGLCLDAYLDMSAILNLDDCLEQDLAVTVLFASVLEPDLLEVALKLPGGQIEVLDSAPLKAKLLGQGAQGTPSAPEEREAPSAPQTLKPDALTLPQTPQPASPIIPEASTVPPRPPAHASAAEEPDGSRASRESKDAGTDSIRVRVGLLSTLMNLAGELVLGRNQLLRTMADHAQAYPGLPGILQNINQVTTELQEAAMQTRMQPVGGLFGRFPRVIRDMARRLDKRMELEIRGGEVELDRSILELLGDPLTHIIRNAADHAIETPAERQAAGKDPSGHILLNAFHEGGQVNILVQDDGRGIDPRKVGAKAVEKGLISADRMAAMGDQELLDLVFAPGFSTAERISDISGRGVGMDVVRTNVERLGGQVELSSQVGRGTTVRLRLPLTLAIIPSMIVATGDQRFAIPQVDVVELVWVKAEDVVRRVERVQGAEVLRLRDKLLPLLRLADVLRIPRTFKPPGEAGRLPDRRKALADRRGPAGPEPSGLPEARPERGPDRRQDPGRDCSVVVLQLGENPFGVIVDELHDFEEIVVKPLSRWVEGLSCYAGTTILGDGRVIMILDSAGLAAQAGLHFAALQAEEQRRREEEQRRAARSASRRRSVILFEAGRGERFAVPQHQVLRLEQIRAGAIERVGDREYITYRGESLPLVRLDRHMDVSPLRQDLTCLHLVIPYLEEAPEKPPAGILISTILDALDVEAELKPVAFQAPGLLGSAVIQDHMTLFLDPVALVRSIAGGRP